MPLRRPCVTRVPARWMWSPIRRDIRATPRFKALASPIEEDDVKNIRRNHVGARCAGSSTAMHLPEGYRVLVVDRATFRAHRSTRVQPLVSPRSGAGDSSIASRDRLQPMPLNLRLRPVRSRGAGTADAPVGTVRGGQSWTNCCRRCRRGRAEIRGPSPSRAPDDDGASSESGPFEGWAAVTERARSSSRGRPALARGRGPSGRTVQRETTLLAAYYTY